MLTGLGSGGIHWCGNGDQWQSEVVSIDNLACLDWGNPEMLDLETWSNLLRERQLPVAQMGWWPRADGPDPTELFPTGAAFTVYVEDLEQAVRIQDRGTFVG